MNIKFTLLKRPIQRKENVLHAKEEARRYEHDRLEAELSALLVNGLYQWIVI